jgi:hypothetical protein
MPDDTEVVPGRYAVRIATAVLDHLPSLGIFKVPQDGAFAHGIAVVVQRILTGANDDLQQMVHAAVDHAIDD